MLRGHVIRAVFKRNVLSYFSGLIGYLFIIVFVVMASFGTFQARFFTDNAPTLDLLTQWFPWLLLFIVPAITMNTWADEKRTGTDELLFTLPGSDASILIGKYLAVAAIYTIALCFSMTQLMFLGWLGDPDWGVIATTYFGYWVAGCSLITAGMFASVLTSSTPVAFILGVVFCAVPVFLGDFNFGSNTLISLSVAHNLRDFSFGLINLSSVMYFATFAAIMLYLNHIAISRRHWGAGREIGMSTQFVIRTLCLLATLVSLTYMTAYATSPLDFSSEKLFTLSNTTRELLIRLGEKEPKRTVEITAYISPEVPRQYLETRKSLIGILDRLDKLGGDLVSVRTVAVEPFSKESDEAANLGIESVSLASETNGRVETIDVFLGAVVTSSFDQVVIPFFGKGLPIEYELSRAIGTVSEEHRLKIGILRTDAEVVQANDSDRNREWQVVRALRMNYDVIAVDPGQKIPVDAFDVLLAIMPSSLTQPEMTNLVNYVRSSAPVLIFDDPLPYFLQRRLADGRPGVTMAPSMPKPSPGGNMGMMGMMGNRPQAPPKADDGRLTSLLDVLQIGWRHDEIVWDTFNPHLEFNISGEFVFVSPESGVATAIEPDSPITSGMQELLVAYSGTIQKRANMNDSRTFQPLLRTSLDAGLVRWPEFTSQSFDIFSMSPAVALKPLDNSVLALFHVDVTIEKEPRRLKLEVRRADGETPLPIPSAALSVEIDTAVKSEKKSLKVTAEPREGEPNGRSSVFVVAVDELPPGVVTPRDLVGAIRARIEGEDYTGMIRDGSPEKRGGVLTLQVPLRNTKSHVLAARVREKGKVNAIFVADIDMISDWFFMEREQQNISLVFDNVSFVMNAIDSLADDETFLELRKRRARLRTLTHLQRQRDTFILNRNEAEARAKAEADNQLKAARKRFEEERKRIEEDETLDRRSKEQLLASVMEAEERRVEVAGAIIEREKSKQIKLINREMQRSIRQIELKTQVTAIIVSFLPAMILGLAMMLWMIVSEKRTVTPERSVK